MKTTGRLTVLFGLLMTSSCGNEDVSYTAGIGKYPGRPSENFAPAMVPAGKEYRNLALLRASSASSSANYNLTAQLVTDGRVQIASPEYLEVSIEGRPAQSNEREWMIDDGPHSCITLYREDTFLQYDFVNYEIEASSLELVGKVAYDPAVAKQGYRMKISVSQDGQHWKSVAVASGAGLPGVDSGKMKKVDDPNKETEPILLPCRKLDATYSFEEQVRFSHLRIEYEMTGADTWFFYGMTLRNDRGEVQELKPSRFGDSVWRSAGSGEEWVTVDLGVASEIEAVTLDWVNKAVKGRIQLSEDGEKWTDAVALPGGDALHEELQFPQPSKGRYVRLLMQESADGQPYMLSEMAVWGRGGLKAVPAAQASSFKDSIRLSGGNWKLQRSSEVVGSGEEISTEGYQTEDWVIATVPGTVLSSFVNVGAVPDPNFADNQLQLSESYFWSDFWYRDEFEVPATFKGEHVFLNFDGINWKAQVYLNGQYVGKIEGAFLRGRFEVTELLVPGKNVLAVKIIRNAHPGAVKEKTFSYSDKNGGYLGADNPTFHASIGWDWIPTIRGRNIGIWNDVTLTAAGAVTMDAPYVSAVLPLPDTTSATLNAEIRLRNHRKEAVSGELSFSMADIHIVKKVELGPEEERSVVLTPDEYGALKMEHPQLWWPNGYGEPYLYEATFSFRTAEGVSQQQTFKVGIRQMSYRDENGRLQIYVNGRRFVGKGGNWGFSESNLNYRGREYETAVAYHADMNLTMIRNWVGMIGDEEFYEACDRHGIMIWQDFWLANPVDGPDPFYPGMFVENAEDYVFRIRQHASIGIYCGRNEGHPDPYFNKELERIVTEEHPGLLYIPGSADTGVSGHGPYRLLPYEEYFKMARPDEKMHTERGMPNVMTYEGLKRTFSEEALWPQCGQWGLHDFTMGGAQSCRTFNQMVEGYGHPSDVRDFAEYAQWANYDGHRSMFEARSVSRMGLLMWMSHPCWPSMTWQTYDYYFEPTAAYFGIKKACEPLHIQWNRADDQVEVVNWSAGMHQELVAEASLYNMDGSLVWTDSRELDSREDTTIPVFALDFTGKLSPVHFIRLRLREGERVVSENFYTHSLNGHDYTALQQLPEVRLSVKRSEVSCRNGVCSQVIRLENSTEVPALMIRLNLLGRRSGKQILPVIYEDNYFSLLPGESRTVRVTWKEEDTAGETGRVSVEGYNLK